MSKYSDPITATGSLISFDAPEGGIFDSLSVPITPTQDLHGYDHPWPAGGGINLFDMDAAVPGYITETGKSIYNPDAQNMTSDFIPVTAGEKYTYTAWPSEVGIGYWTGWCFYGSKSMSDNIGNRLTASRTTVTITVPTGAAYIRIGSRYLASGKAQFEKGSVGHNWSPYSNVCPISGRTGLSVYVGPTQDQQDATTYAVDWTSEAGTVYGGTLDVVTGVLTVDRAMVDLGTLNWRYSASAAQFRASLNYAKDTTSTEVPNMKCEIYKAVSFAGMANNDMCISRFFASVDGINVKDSRYTDAATFKTAMSGVQLCYELATPLTYQLTAQEIETLVGTNNVWVDTSAVITLIYRLLQVDRQTDRTSIGKRAESLEVLGKFSSISKVEVNVTENLFYEAGDSSGRTLTVDCPFGTQAMANNLLAMLQGYVYQPFEARRSIANPATELGDGVTVGDVYGGIYAIYHKCGPLHLADLSAPADEEIDHEYKFTPAFERKVERRLNNMQSELSVQAGEISAKVDRQGGDPSSVSWKMDADVFKVAVDGSDVLTVNENGLTVNGDGNFTGNVYAGNIRYGGSAGTMSGNGITSRSIGTGRLTSGINTSLGNADYSADVFSGAVVARFMKANVMSTTTFNFNNIGLMLNTRTVKDGSGNNLTIKYLGVY